MFTSIETDEASLRSEAFRTALNGRAIRHGSRAGKLTRGHDGALVASWSDGTSEPLTKTLCSAALIDVRPGDFATAAAPPPPATTASTEAEPEKVGRIAATLAKTSPSLGDAFIRTMGYRTPAMVEAERAAAARIEREAQLKIAGDIAAGRPVACAKIEVPPGQEQRFAQLQALGKAISAKGRDDTAASAVKAPPGSEARVEQLKAIARAASR